MLQKLQKLPKLQKSVLGNAATATSASKCTGNSATTTKLATARTIALSGAVKGSAIFDGSSNITIPVTLGNISILSGTIVMPDANNSALGGSKDISYPSGFNKDNCIVLSIMSYNSTHIGWWATPQSPSTSSALWGNGNTYVILKANNITIACTKNDIAMPRKDVTFKIALMKIS